MSSESRNLTLADVLYTESVGSITGDSSEEIKRRQEIDSASTSQQQDKYEVFLSFRGEDTRHSFTSHLYRALKDRGIHTFIDDQLRQGEELAPALVRAIEGSRVAIVIFSENYANSGWCLDELVKIVECNESMGQTLMPVFYKVDPSQVRKHETGNFAQALSRHEDRLQNPSKVKMWKEALTKAANHKGWHLNTYDCESKFIQDIVKEVVFKVDSKQLHLSDDLVGMDSHIRAVSSLLVVGGNDVRMIGICGMGGIGKTTIAKNIYNQIQRRFEFSNFLANVRETCEKHPQSGLLHLQDTLLSNLLWDDELKYSNVDEVIHVIKRMMRNKKVLIVIDDVDHLGQLETLAGGCDWFGPGSRIIITTRDKHLLVSHGVKQVYNVQKLLNHDALCLFSWAAFQKSSPEENYYSLSTDIIQYASGLPLALKVLGSSLRGRSVSEWTSAIGKLKRVPDKEIFRVLEISFETLDDYEKAIFLDIACFFKGQPVDYVKKVLEACNLYPESGIQILLDKCLITITSGVIEMHDMIEEMGKEIVRQGSSDEPSERTRLWFHEDVLDVLTEDTGTNKIQGIKLDFNAPTDVCFSDNAFTNMKRLRLFMARNAKPSCDASLCLPNGLRWLEWPEYTLQSLPFGPAGQKKLVGLSMKKSSIELLGQLKAFNKLRFINFNHSAFLSKLPDLSSLQDLETLDVSECKSLTEVHESLGYLEKLVHLNFENCSNLSSFSSSLTSKQLQSLILKGCLKLSRFPNILVEIKGTKELILDETAIDELPNSIGNFVGLKRFYLKGCKKLKSLPKSIYGMQLLERLHLNGCSLLENFPETSESTSSSILPNLIYLDLQGCNLSDVSFLKGFQCVSTLIVLNLSGNKLLCIPKGINRFIKLHQLNLTNCRQLRSILDIPPNISHLFAEGCESLESFSSLPSMLQTLPGSPLLRRIALFGCDRLNRQSETNIHEMLSIEEMLGNSRIDIFYPGSEVPRWFTYHNTERSFGTTERPESLAPEWFRLYSTEGLLRFEVPSNLYPEIVGLAFCSVAKFEKPTNISISCEIQLFVNKERTYGYVENFPYVKSDHSWLSYIPRNFMRELDTKLTHECSRFVVLFKVSGAKLGSCGVHLVCRQKGMVHTRCVFEESDEDSQESKRRREQL